MGSIIKVNEYKDFGNNAIMTSDGAGTITASAGLKTAIGQNTPSFFAYADTGEEQTLTNNTEHKIVLGGESWDTASAFGSNKWTPGVAGTYYLYGIVYVSGDNVTELEGCKVKIFKNGSEIASNNIDTRNGGKHYIHHLGVSVMNVANTTDYYELYAQVLDSDNSQSGVGVESTYFMGFKIIT